MADLTDDQLLKRATHAGRNLSVLAILASLGGIGLLVVAVKGAPFFLGVLAASITLIAGFLTLNGAAFVVGSKAAEQRTAELRGVTAFTQMLSTEEQQFLKSVGNLASDNGSDRLENALARVNTLEERIAHLKAAPES